MININFMNYFYPLESKIFINSYFYFTGKTPPLLIYIYIYIIFRELIAVCSENYTKHITGLKWKFLKYVITVELQTFVGYILLYIFLESLIIITNLFSTHMTVPLKNVNIKQFVEFFNP